MADKKDKDNKKKYEEKIKLKTNFNETLISLLNTKPIKKEEKKKSK